MFADYHVHSYFSEDTDFPMELEIQKAIELGMDELCFTEHSDYDVPTVVNCDYDAYFKEMEEMKEKYKGLTILSIAHRESSLTYCERIITIKNEHE